MNGLVISPEILQARDEGQQEYRLLIECKNSLAIEAASVALEVAMQIDGSVSDVTSKPNKPRHGNQQWSVTGLPLPETDMVEQVSSFVVSTHKATLSRNSKLELLGVSGHSLELVDGKQVLSAFEVSVNNTAYHPKFGRPYIDFLPLDIDKCDDNPETLRLGYVNAGERQIASAEHVIGLMTSVADTLNI